MFDASSSQQPIANSVSWLADTLLGELAITLCVVAVALVGFSMLTGRLSLRRGARVVLGCFILLGAPLLAANLTGLAQDSSPTGALVFDAYGEALGPREQLAPATFDPDAPSFVVPGPPPPVPDPVSQMPPGPPPPVPESVEGSEAAGE